MSNLNIFIQSQIKDIVQSDKEFAVAFDEAWQWLEYSSKGNAKRTLTANFVEGIDYSSLITIEKREIGATRVEEIYLTKDCFKQLAMLSGTEKGKAVRLYYLECEKQVKAIYSGDYLATLKALVAAQEEKQALMLEAAELRPKAEDWDSLCNDQNYLSIEKVAKTLAIKGMGRNNLFEWLRDKGILYLDGNGNNVPYQRYVESGYFLIKTKVNSHTNKTNSVTLATPKGFSFIKRRLIEYGYVLPPVPNAGVLPLPYQVAA